MTKQYMWDKRLILLENWKKEQRRKEKKKRNRNYPTDRSQKMADMYADGKTLREVGEHFDLSTERIRQILKQRHPEIEMRTHTDYAREKKRIVKCCVYCGEEMELVPSQDCQKYCSKQCFHNDITKSPYETDTPEYKEWRKQQMKKAQARYYERNKDKILKYNREYKKKNC